jgi:hypothetical protein
MRKRTLSDKQRIEHRKITFRKYRIKNHKKILKAHRLYNSTHKEQIRLARLRESRAWNRFLLKNPVYTKTRWAKFRKEQREKRLQK